MPRPGRGPRRRDARRAPLDGGARHRGTDHAPHEAALLRPIFAALLVLALGACSAEPAKTSDARPRVEKKEHRCGVCGERLEGDYVWIEAGFEYHVACWERTPRCDGCGLPAAGSRGPLSRWPDGRVSCALCKKEAVTSQSDADLVIKDARRLLAEALSLDLGRFAVPIELVSKPELLRQAKEVGQPAICAFTFVSEEEAGGGKRGARTYKIFALSGLPRPALTGILGHELYHVLQHETSPDERDAAFREGSANYVQWALFKARGDLLRARLLERDTDPVYGDGLRRFQALVRAKGEKEALRLGVRSVAFPQGF